MGIILSAILIFFGIFILVYIISIFNELVELKNNIKKAWANVDVLLKQRYDELPNLIESVKGYMRHEQKTLLLITQARTNLMNAQTMSNKAKASDTISQSLKNIFAIAENYPKLQANQNFLKLQERISALENEIADRREFYNDSVNNYNIRIESFPEMFMARIIKYTKSEMFKANETEQKNISVDINK